MKRIAFLLLILAWGFPVKAQQVPINYNATTGTVLPPKPGVNYNFPTGSQINGIPIASTSNGVTSVNTLTGSLTLATTSTGTTNSVTPSGSTITFNIGTAQAAPLSGIAGMDATVKTAAANATVGTGTSLVSGSVDSAQNLIIAPSGTTTSVILNPSNSVQLPNILVPIGPTGGSLLMAGDSLYAGVGGGGLYAPSQAGGATPTSGPFTGQHFSVPDFVASNPTFQNLVNTTYNLGVSGQTVYNANANFNASAASSTGTWTTSTASITMASVTGFSSGQAVAASNGAFPVGTTISSITSNTLTLSKTPTVSGTGITVYAANASSYGAALAFSSAPFLLSNTVTGTTSFAVLAYGTNSYYTGCITASGTAVTGNGTITGLSINATVSYSGASISSALNGYEVYGGGSTTNGQVFTDLGTGVFTGTTVVVSNPGAVLSSMTNFKFEPQITSGGSDGNSAGTANSSTLTVNYTNLVNNYLNAGDQVMVCTLYPFVNPSTGYTQGQYDEQRLKFNAWLRTTFGTGTYTNSTTNTVTLCDTGLIPQLQYLSNSQYTNYRNATGTSPHLNALGYSLVAAQTATAFAANYPSFMQGYASILAQGGIAGAQLPLGTVRVGQSDWTSGNTYLGGGGVFVMNQQLVCGVNATGQQISGDGFECYGATAEIFNDANASGQLQIRGKTTPNKKLFVGFDTVNNHGLIDAEWSGTASEPIYLNPIGQQPVVVGYGNTYSATGDMLQVNGAIAANGAVKGTGGNFSSLTASTLVGTDGSKNLISKTAGTDYTGPLTVQTFTLVGGTTTKTVPAGCHPWVVDTASSLTNVGSLTVTVSGTTATITSTNVLDTSTGVLFNAGSQ